MKRTLSKKIKQTVNLFFLISIITLFGSLKAIALESEVACKQHINIAPTSITSEIQEKSHTHMILKGETNPKGNPTISWFEYGTNPSVRTNTGFMYSGKGNQNQKVEINVENLENDTIYYYRIVSQNDFGTTAGQTISFKTI